MTLIRTLVVLALLLASSAMAEDQVPETVLLKQRALPPVPAVVVAPVSKVQSRAVMPRALGPLAITGVTIQSPANPAAVPLFGTVELAIAIDTDVVGVNRYNPDPATGGLDLSATFTGPSGSITRNGFFHGTSSKWLVRFAPTVAGAWTCVVTAKDPGTPAGVTMASPGFTVVTSANPGFIRISGSRLRFSGDNSLFYGIGHNNGWQTNVEQPTLAQMKSTYGENLLSFWLSQPWTSTGSRGVIESTSSGIGNYNQSTCDYLDGVFQRAELSGVYLMPSIWAHDALRAAGHSWGAGNWTNNAYSTICTFPIDFFDTSISSPAWIAQQRFYRYLIARYGHSTALAGWIGLVEMEGTSGYVANPGTVTAWCQQVRNYFTINDPYRATGTTYPGATYPISFSKSDEGGASANTLGTTYGFPLHVADSYITKNSNSGIANTIATATRTMGGFGTVGGAPAFHTEFGAPVGGGASDPLHYHNAIWAGVSAGACLTPLKWCDGGSWPMFTDATYGPAYRDHTKYLSAFVNTSAVKDVMNNPAAIASTIAFPGFTGRVGWGLQGSDHGFAWLHRTAGTAMASTAVTLTNCPPGHYLIDWFDTWTDGDTPVSSGSTDITSGSTLALIVPSGITRSDVAVTFRRVFTGTSQSVTVDSKGNTIITLDGTGGGTLTGAAIATLPARGTLFQAPGGIKGVQITSAGPVSDTSRRVWYEAPTPGVDSFNFTVTDGSNTSAAGTVSIIVRNRAPSFDNPGALTVGEDSGAYSNTWATSISSDTAPGSLLDGAQTLTFQLTGNTNPALFSALPAISSTGTLTFTPAANQHGTANVTVALKDNGGTAGGGSDTSATSTLTINVTSQNDAPIATALTIPNAYANQAKTIALAATDPDGDTLTFAIDAGPSQGTLSATSGTPVVYTATAGYAGPDSFTYHANDGTVNSGIVTVSITVFANTSPTANAQSVSVTQNTASGITLTGSDDGLPNATLTFAVTSGPTHGTLSGTAPFLTYQPVAGYSGADAFSFTVNDGATSSLAATVAITVTAGGGTSVPVGNTTSGGGCGLGGTTAAALLALFGLLAQLCRLVRSRNDR